MLLKDLCEKVIDNRGKTPPLVLEGKPLIEAQCFSTKQFVYKNDAVKYLNNEIYNLLRSGLCKENDILVTLVGNIGHCALAKEEFAIAQNIIALRIDIAKANPLYVYYFTKTKYFKNVCEKLNRSSVQPSLNANDFLRIEINLPDRKTQDKIVEILSNIDNQIERNNCMVKRLQDLASSIYSRWFNQFEFPNEENKPYKSSGGEMVWNEKLNREIPKGWKVGVIEQYISKDKGGDWGKEINEGNYTKKVVCLRGADLPSITNNLKLEAPTRFILEKNAFKSLKHGDIIIEISGGSPTQSTGRVCYVNNMLLKRFNTDIITSNFCKAISLKKPEQLYWFYMQWKVIYDNNILFKYEGKTTGIKNFLFDVFVKDYKIVMPEEKIVAAYNEKVAILFDEIQQKQKENQELTALKNFLLPLLINGQLKV